MRKFPGQKLDYCSVVAEQRHPDSPEPRIYLTDRAFETVNAHSARASHDLRQGCKW